MPRRYSRLLAAALIAVSGTAMLAATFDADARRMGGGGSFGRQSANVATQRQAVTPPAASSATPRAAAPAAGAAAGATAGAARSGASRWFGPIAGIAAGLGLAALLSHLGLSAAFAEFLASALLVALAVFAVLFLLRRLRGPRPAMQGAGTGGPALWRNAQSPAGAARPSAAGPAAQAAPPAAAAAPGAGVGNWSVPGDFDTPRFLQTAKTQFVEIQKIWDSGDMARLRDYLTDDLIAELQPQLAQRREAGHTEVVLLNAELLGIETVAGGHLASVRYSGMLREERGTEAFRFEEVWNLFKPETGGWLLAGIQQIPVEYAS